MTSPALIILHLSIVLVVLAIFFLTKAIAIRRVVIAVVFAYVLDALFFGGGSVRALAEAARSAGRSEDFVQGIAEMNHVMLPVKARAALGVVVLSVIALAGTARKGSKE